MGTCIIQDVLNDSVLFCGNDGNVAFIFYCCVCFKMPPLNDRDILLLISPGT